MCGIAGIIGGTRDRKAITDMCRAMSHRGPDNESTFIRPEGALGHCRLSILDLSPQANQPMFSRDGSLVIVFNGEIYNYRQLREQLVARGYTFTTNTDTEVLLYMYQEYGEDCVQYIGGMFAFCIWDIRRNLCFIARDRLGKKPLYYWHAPGELVFASEIKAILRLKYINPEVNYAALDDYLSYLYIPAPQTIYKGIYKLEPGHYMIWENGDLRIVNYWNPKLSHGSFSYEEAREAVENCLLNSVAKRLVSDVPIGVFLSGGLDSSSIVALMAHLSDSPIQTFSIGYGPGISEYNESHYARLVARHFRTEHHEFIIDFSDVDTIPTLTRQFDEPFGNPTALLTYFLSTHAKKFATVGLVGDGGDELFLGYPRYVGVALRERYLMIPKCIRRVFERYIMSRPHSKTGKHLIRRAQEFVDSVYLAPVDMYHNWVTYLSEAERANLLVRKLKTSTSSIIADYFWQYEEDDLLNQISYVDLKTFVPYNLLECADKMGMLASFELRAPFLDHELVELMMTIPSEFKYRHGKTKYMLKDIMSKYLPKEIIHRRKQGFNPPMVIWLRNNLEYIERSYLNRNLIMETGILCYDGVKGLLDLFKEGKRDVSTELWGIIMLMSWVKQTGSV
jgi:asparagine synthase (glutamine-hydrolysing)